MMTIQQQQKIVDFLLDKRISIDLVLEIKDHMMDQCTEMMDVEHLNFEQAFEKTKECWKDELKMVYNFNSLSFKKIAKIQKDSLSKIYGEQLLKSLKFFIPFLIAGAVLTLFAPAFANTFFLVVYAATILVTIFYNVKYYRLNESSTAKEKRRISIYQRGTILFRLAGIYIILFNLMSFESRMLKYKATLYQLTHHKIINFDGIFNLINPFIFVGIWILGLLYFLQYKNSVSKIKERVKLNL